MTAFYNEIDPNAAEWLRQLIKAGHIAPGIVEEKSIVELDPQELKRYTQCHFFAGIGVWSYALRRAGWSDDRPVWTGSCPCQPFSSAGKGETDRDSRHLAPAWLRLIKECRPATIFGEQVSAAIRVGWLDELFTEMEQLDYACGAVDFPACSVGAPHIRQRIYFVADASSNRRAGKGAGGAIEKGWEQESRTVGQLSVGLEGSSVDMVGDSNGEGLQGSRPERSLQGRSVTDGLGRPPSADEQLAYAENDGRNGRATDIKRGGEPDEQNRDDDIRSEPSRQGENEQLAYAENVGKSGKQYFREIQTDEQRRNSIEGHEFGRSDSDGFWSDADWIPCRDGKHRAIKPGTLPLVNGPAAGVGRSGDTSLPDSENTAEARVMRLKGYGNAIVAPQATEFIKAYLSV